MLPYLQFKNLGLLHERMLWGKEKTRMNLHVINHMSLFAFKFPYKLGGKKKEQCLSLGTP